MSIPAECLSCGYKFISRALYFADSTNITITGSSETCPNCGGRAALQSGTYDFVGDMISAFRAPGITKEKVRRFKDLATDLNSGKLSQDDAEAEAEKIGPQFVKILKTVHENGITFDRVISVITLLFLIWTQSGSDADVQATLEGIGQQIELSKQQLDATEQQTETSQELLVELRKLRSDVQEQEAKKAELRPASKQMPTSGQPNRHDRRKAAAIARRNGD